MRDSRNSAPAKASRWPKFTFSTVLLNSPFMKYWAYPSETSAFGVKRREAYSVYSGVTYET